MKESVPEIALKNRIIETGPVTFAEFMESALYSGKGGYYTSGPGQGERWGRTGDYFTSLDVSPVFPKVIAREVVEMWGLLGSPERFYLIDAGAGRGSLSKGIIEAIKEASPRLYSAIRARAVERNPALHEPPSKRLTWHTGLSEIRAKGEGGSAGVTGVIISNELIDSLPVHRVVGREGGDWGGVGGGGGEGDGGLRELYVGLDGEEFVWVEGPPSTGALEAYLKRVGLRLADGQKAEINLLSGDWIREAARVLERGFVITIDYGLPARELYSPERREGTLLCHFRHTLNDNPFVNVGRQDITAHVDFTTLALGGEEAGLQVTGFTTQKNFLLGLGILDEMKAIDMPDSSTHGSVNFNRALASLIAPGGMGDSFKVLIQHKGLERPTLSGFSFKDMTRSLAMEGLRRRD